MEWRKRRRHEEPEHHEPESQPREARREGVPEGSAKEFARGESHVADVTADRFDGLGKGFAHGEVSEETEALADHGIPEGSGKQFARGEAEIVWDDDRVGDLSKGYAKGQAHLAGAEDPESGPLH
jgi:hypothetical protein